AVFRLGGDARAVGHLHVGAAGFDGAAVAAAGRAGVERAADLRRAGLHAGEQQDVTGPALHGLRFDDAVVVDRAGEQAVPGAGAENDLSAVGLDQAAVTRQGAECALPDLELDELVAGRRELGGAAGAEHDTAEVGLHAAQVDGLVADQGERAAVAGLELALVDDAVGI